MNVHDATETAYKNGYKNAVREMQERLKTEFKDWLGIPYIIDQIAKELIGETNDNT